ncbi:hypothetical protein [Treponema sp.]|uniref:hypothetical protein n=1 Tax=Treponema sp. TaxID=166 RepID=UPI00298E63E7|nr:hypothetical protein [Treponema sp.]MCQ2241920.1 hypothetical protein [Treponema sp.]
MKKTLIAFAASVLFAAAASAQVLPKAQMKNTFWSGFGNPYAGDTMLYGFTDTMQARFDKNDFIVEGMLNTSFLANYDNKGDVDNFVFGTSNQNALSLHYGRLDGYTSDNTVKASAKAIDGNYSNAVYSQNTTQDSYYVNFLYHLNQNFDLGVGTKLNWQVGPCPRYGAWLFEPGAHSRQGGFSTSYDDRGGVRTQTSSELVHSYKFNVHNAGNRPGTADVVGFVPYANKYAKRALGVRFKTDKKSDIGLELGVAIPNGFNTDDPASNFGAKVTPCDWLSFSAAMEGAFDEQANFYTGATIGMKNFVLDVYFAADSLFSDAKNDEAYGLGASITFIIPSTDITLRPEAGLNWFEDDNYSSAFYTGCELDLPLTKEFELNVWGSFASGSKDKRWDDAKATEDWDGGTILNLKPGIKFIYSSHTTFNAYLNLESRTAFDGQNRKAWSSGLFVTYIF